MTTAIILLVIVLTLIYFYLKCSPMTSFVTLTAAILAGVTALSYHEAAAGLLLSRGYGVQWALAGSYLAVFVVAFALVRGLADYLVNQKLDFGKPVKTGAAVVCGLLAGLILAGNLLIVISLTPLQGKFFYNRFPQEGGTIQLNNPAVPLLNPDGFVVGFYSWLSRGSLASRTSFAVVQADFVTKTHLNRFALSNEVWAVTSPDCLVLPPRNKRPVRLWQTPDHGTLTVVRVGIAAKKIEEGGGYSDKNQIRFAMAQLRLICKSADDADTLRGKGSAVLPEGLFKGGALVQKQLHDVVDEKDVAVVGLQNRVLWLDVAFKVPAGQAPVAFQFKQNATISLLGFVPTQTTPDIEQELDAGGDTAPAAAGV